MPRAGFVPRMTLNKLVVLLVAMWIGAGLATLVGLTGGAAFAIGLVAAGLAWGGMEGLRETLQEQANQRWDEGTMRPRVFDARGTEIDENAKVQVNASETGTVQAIE